MVLDLKDVPKLARFFDEYCSGTWVGADAHMVVMSTTSCIVTVTVAALASLVPMPL